MPVDELVKQIRAKHVEVQQYELGRKNQSADAFAKAKGVLPAPDLEPYHNGYDQTYFIATRSARGPNGRRNYAQMRLPGKSIEQLIGDALAKEELPEPIEKSILRYAAREPGNNLLFGLMNWLEDRGHKVYGPAPEHTNVFDRLAEAIRSANDDDTPDLVPARWFKKNTMISADNLRQYKEQIGWKKVDGGQNLYSKSGAKSRWPHDWVMPKPEKVTPKPAKA